VIAESGGEAVANARRFTGYPPGYCLKFVRAEAWQIGSLYGSAIDAWYGAVHRHPGDRHPPLGAPMFYSGGQYGHIVIDTDTGRMRSTDCEYSGQVSETDTDWPVRNFGQTYLGWTSDLNGIELPVGKKEEEDEMTSDDWKKLRSIVAEEVHSEMEKQRPEYTKSVLYWGVQEDPETNVRQALRLSANHAREHDH
jgi:hypothetical protein